MYNEDNENMKEDKILNNSYNSGNSEYNVFTESIQINAKVANQYKDNLSDDIVDVRREKKIAEQIYSYFSDSEFFEKYKIPKRVDKSDMIKMFYFFKKKLLPEKTFSNIEIFIGFAEFFQINYDQLYTEIGVKDKDEILRELHSDSNIKNKIKTKKLF
jgi:hypothetical protein